MNHIIPFLTFFAFFFTSSVQGEVPPAQLTFTYTKEEIDSLKNLPVSRAKISNQELNRLIQEVAYLTKTSDLSGMEQTLLPAYLANAQKDFALLSKQISGSLSGNLTPVTLWTLQLFKNDASLPTATAEPFDVYSSEIASLVVSKAAQRLKEEKSQIHLYPVKRGENLWKPTSPGYTGLDYGSAMTWYLTSSSEFMTPPPPQDTTFWKNQCEQCEAAQKKLTGKKVEAVYEWAGLTSPEAGSWEAIFDNYQEEKNIPVEERLLTRALFLSALADSNAASFNSKYTYWVKRPSQRDNNINPLVTIPNHPSYPSAHSTIGGTASTVLTKMYPEDSKRWNEIAEEAGMSRIWGGIHYPVDHQEGLKLGQKVGNSAWERANATPKK